jgi:hypothetical protein
MFVEGYSPKLFPILLSEYDASSFVLLHCIFMCGPACNYINGLHETLKMHSLILQNLKHYSQANLLNSRGVTEDIINFLALGVLCFIILKGCSFCGLA